jgi:hypothetical protein
VSSKNNPFLLLTRTAQKITNRAGPVFLFGKNLTFASLPFAKGEMERDFGLRSSEIPLNPPFSKGEIFAK